MKTITSKILKETLISAACGGDQKLFSEIHFNKKKTQTTTRI